MEPQQIRIIAEVSQQDPESCKFTVDRPLFSGFARFSNKEKAKGSPLAEKLFEITGVVGVQVADHAVTISKQGFENWRTIGPSIGAAIRAHIQSGQPAVSLEKAQNLPADDKLRGKIQRILDEEINPAVAGHGGHVSLLDVQGRTIYIKMGGGCQGCGMANATLRGGIERVIREKVPEVEEILDVTDHAGGTNPYYAPSKK